MSWTPATASDRASPATWRSQPWWSLAACVLALLLVGAATFTRTWHVLEFKTFDVLTALAAPQRSALPVVILAIDEPTFQELQQPWPFPRSVHAALLQRLHADGAAAVGFDVVFAEPSTEAEDAALDRAIAEAGPVVLAATREKIDGSNAALWLDVLPLQRFLDAGADAGDAGVEPDDDFVVRRAPVARESFALRLAQRAAEARGQQRPALRHFDWIGYRGARGTFDTRSYYQALEPGLLPAGFFKNKIVLVGRSARTATELTRSQADLFNSPFGTAGGERLFPGVELQATLVDNYLMGGGLRSVHEGWTLALVLLVLPVLLWGNRRLPLAGAAALAAALVVAIALGSWWLFARFQLWWPPLLPAAATAAIYGGAALAGYAAVRQRARQTRAMFAQYVPPAVVERLIAQPELMRLGGESREVTLMFTDLASFTTLSEQLSADQTVEVLTAYFNAMTPIVHATGGTLDKFIGDAVMAFWGAPLDDAQHAEHAVAAAIAMQQAMQALVAGLAARGLPPIHGLAPDRHQPHLAFLHDLLRRQGLAAGLQPGVAAAQRGVTGKTHLTAGREDTHPVVGASGAASLGGRQKKRGFRQVGPVRKLQHLGIRQPTAVQHHGQRVAQQCGGRENIHLFKRAVAGGGGRGQGRHTRE